jgi:signal peptidase I
VLVPPTNADRDYIKRIIALPGERVQVSNGQVFINAQPLPEAYPLNHGSYNMPPITIPPDEYFVLGDNRDNSSDSHLWGTLARDQIVGKVWVTYWPPPLIGFAPDYSKSN